MLELCPCSWEATTGVLKPIKAVNGTGHENLASNYISHVSKHLLQTVYLYIREGRGIFSREASAFYCNWPHSLRSHVRCCENLTQLPWVQFCKGGGLWQFVGCGRTGQQLCDSRSAGVPSITVFSHTRTLTVGGRRRYSRQSLWGLRGEEKPFQYVDANLFPI